MEEHVNASSGGSPRIFIPDVLAKWPWVRQIHPDHAELEKETATWLEGIHIFSPKAQDAFRRARLTLFTCLIYPNISKEGLKRANDLNYLAFMFDEYSDKSTPSEVCNQKDILLDAFRNPHIPRPEGEWIGGEMARQFWRTHIENTTEVYQKRFIQDMLHYFEGVKQESIDRHENRIMDIETYSERRFLSAGSEAAFSPIELELDIPNDVMTHPDIQEMTLVAGEIGILCNDIISYNVEQMRGDIHNIIPCVMKAHDTDVNGAMLWVQHRISGLIERFLAIMASLPRGDEPIHSQVKKYCDSLGQLVRGNYEWCFESERYLGNKGPEIRKARWMSLLPKKPGEKEIGPVHVDGSLL